MVAPVPGKRGTLTGVRVHWTANGPGGAAGSASGKRAFPHTSFFIQQTDAVMEA